MNTSDFLNESDLMKDYIYRKDLLEKLCLSDSCITAIVSRSRIFYDIETSRGQSIPFSFNQALCIYIGCELIDLGLSFRYVDEILNYLITLDHHDISDDLINRKSTLLLYKFKGGADMLGKNTFIGEGQSGLSRFQYFEMSKSDADEFTLNDKITSYAKVKVYSLISDVKKLFE